MATSESDDLARRDRRTLTGRQLATFTLLLDAALEQIREGGYETLTVRIVASRAGVTHTTAYAYFSSKEQLVAEVFWQQLQGIPVPTPDPAQPLSARIAEALRGPAIVFDREPELARAGLSLLLTTDADVVRLRDVVGADLVRRIETALGQDADPHTTEAILLAYTGAMLQAGMGYFEFARVVELMDTVAGLLDRA